MTVIARRAPAEPRFDAKARRAIGDLLRHLNHPRRLRTNPFAAAYFQRYDRCVADSNELVARELTAVVRAALNLLPPRPRAIVERCDLGGALQSEMMVELAISPAHFYREHRQALETVAAALVAGAQQATVVRALPDAYSVGLAQASALEAAGRYGAALDALARCAKSACSVSQRVTAFARLVEACALSGRPSDAVRYAAAARSAAGAAESTENNRLEADAAWALALRYSGEELAADELASRLVVPLRAALSDGSTSTLEAFAIVVVLLVEGEVERGSRAHAFTLCEEAITRLRDARARQALHLRAARWLACGDVLLSAEACKSIEQLERLISFAMDNGQVFEAAAAAATLASVHRVFGNPKRALQTLEPLLEVVLAEFCGEDAGGFLFETATAYARTSQPLAALDLVARLRKDPSVGSYIQALSFITEAEVALAIQRAPQALRAAETAVSSMRALGRPRYVGTALRFRALALDRMGDKALATRSIEDAVEHLNAFGSKPTAVRAEIDAARIVGDRGRVRRLTGRLADLSAS
jgi:tetratricopeptide (TPR) repeat protein